MYEQICTNSHKHINGNTYRTCMDMYVCMYDTMNAQHHKCTTPRTDTYVWMDTHVQTDTHVRTKHVRTDTYAPMDTHVRTDTYCRNGHTCPNGHICWNGHVFKQTRVSKWTLMNMYVCTNMYVWTCVWTCIFFLSPELWFCPEPLILYFKGRDFMEDGG